MQRHRQQLKAQREAHKRAAEEHEKKIKDQEGKLDIEVSFDFTPDDLDSALAKMTTAAAKVNKSATISRGN